MNHEESRLQAEIFQFLRRHFPIVFMVPNGEIGKANPAKIWRLKAMGMLNGVSDLVAIDKTGKAIFIEIKTAKGRQSDDQKKFEEKCKGCGAPYHIVKNIEDAKKLVDIYAGHVSD